MKKYYSQNYYQHFSKKPAGFTLAELLVSVAILGVSLIAILGIFVSLYKNIVYTKAKITATALANQKMEEIRNMPYSDIATDVNYPPGEIPHTQTIKKSQIDYILMIIINYVDDPYDGDALGTIPGKPKDLYPYDYKKVDIKVSWANHNVKIVSNISPNGPETATKTGSLVVNIIDSYGKTIQDATVKVTNSQITPPAYITTYTNDLGTVLIPLLPADSHYHIEATKEGYSTDSTFPITEENPSPTTPDATVLEDSATPVTLTIDKLSDLNVTVQDTNNNPVSNISIQVISSKIIGTYPDPANPENSVPIPKYKQSFTTNGQGKFTVENIEWGSYFDSKYDVWPASYKLYTIDPAADYTISSIKPARPVDILPDSTVDATIILTKSQVSKILFLDPVSDIQKKWTSTDPTNYGAVNKGVRFPNIPNITHYLGPDWQWNRIDIYNMSDVDLKGRTAISIHPYAYCTTAPPIAFTTAYISVDNGQHWGGGIGLGPAIGETQPWSWQSNTTIWKGSWTQDQINNLQLKFAKNTEKKQCSVLYLEIHTE